MGHIEHDEHDDDRHYIQVEVEFFDNGGTDSGEEESEWTVGHIQTHFHGVPPNMIVDALLVIARDTVQQGMSEHMFNEAVPDQVREIAARVMATQYLAGRIQNPDIMNAIGVSANVPDDISSLLEPEG